MSARLLSFRSEPENFWPPPPTAEELQFIPHQPSGVGIPASGSATVNWPAPPTPEELQLTAAQPATTGFPINGAAFRHRYNRSNYPFASRVIPGFANRREDWHDVQRRFDDVMKPLKTRLDWLLKGQN
jgi:hypothetical protein